MRPSRKSATRDDAGQGDLFGPSTKGPEGFLYRSDLIDLEEEAALAGRLEGLPFQPFDFYGHLANRRVVGFGLKYDYDQRRVVEAPPIPDFLLALRAKAAGFAGLPAEAFEHALINEYRPGAGIGWHRDRPHFGEVVGVSLLAACDFRLRRKTGKGWDRETIRVEPRSVYLLSGPARTEWEHSVPPVDEHRYSITFRTLRS